MVILLKKKILALLSYKLWNYVIVKVSWRNILEWESEVGKLGYRPRNTLYTMNAIYLLSAVEAILLYDRGQD
jgi:hypothetical protein